MLSHFYDVFSLRFLSVFGFQGTVGLSTSGLEKTRTSDLTLIRRAL